jgi:hypothetical protein
MKRVHTRRSHQIWSNQTSIFLEKWKRHCKVWYLRMKMNF